MNLNHYPTTISPISKLPIELMRRIFLFRVSLDPFSNERGSRHRTPASVYLCHVSSKWRDIAEGFGDLWTEIHIRLSTPPEFLDYMWKRSKNAPISLFVDLRRSKDPNQPSSATPPRLLDGLAAKLRGSCHQIRLLAVQAPEYDLRDIFWGLPDGASFKILEKLSISTDTAHKWTQWDGRYLLSCTAPVLQEVQLTDFQLRPNARIFQSNWISRINVYPTLSHASYYILLAALVRNRDHIQVFNIGVADRDTKMDLPGVTMPLSFPNLRDFSWMGLDSTWDMPLALLRHMRFDPRVLTDFILCPSDAPPADNRHIWFALKVSVFGSAEPAFSPEYVSLGTAILDDETVLEACRYRPDGSGDYDTSTLQSVHDQFTFSIITKGLLTLFSQASQYRDAWSFNGLKTFRVGVESLGEPLWKKIRTLGTLDQLQIDHMAHEQFVEAFVDGLRELPDKVKKIPFPALQTLVIRAESAEDRPHGWGRWRPSIGYRGLAIPDQLDGEQEFALDVAWLLRSRRLKRDPYTLTDEENGAWGERIEHLRFEGFKSDISDEIFWVLELEACHVVWNGMYRP